MLIFSLACFACFKLWKLVNFRTFCAKKLFKNFICFICRIREVHFSELVKKICHLSAVRRQIGHKPQYFGQWKTEFGQGKVSEKSGNFVSAWGWSPWTGSAWTTPRDYLTGSRWMATAILIVYIIIFVCAEKWQSAKVGSTWDGGSLQDQDMGFCSTHLNSVSSQCACGKPSIVRKPEDHPKIFKW